MRMQAGAIKRAEYVRAHVCEAFSWTVIPYVDSPQPRLDRPDLRQAAL